MSTQLSIGQSLYMYILKNAYICIYKCVCAFVLCMFEYFELFRRTCLFATLYVNINIYMQYIYMYTLCILHIIMYNIYTHIYTNIILLYMYIHDGYILAPYNILFSKLQGAKMVRLRGRCIGKEQPTEVSTTPGNHYGITMGL